MPEPLGPPLEPSESDGGRRMTWSKIVVAVLAAGLACLLVIAFFSPSGSSVPEVGSCLSVSGSVETPEVRSLACSASEANVVVTELPKRAELGSGGLLERCDPLEAALAFEEDEDLPAGICLRPNAAAGECWNLAEADWPSRATCTGGGDVFRVLDVLQGTVDPGRCGQESWYAVLTSRSVVYCFEPKETGSTTEAIQGSGGTDV